MTHSAGYLLVFHIIPYIPPSLAFRVVPISLFYNQHRPCYNFQTEKKGKGKKAKAPALIPLNAIQCDEKVYPRVPNSQDSRCIFCIYRE